MKTVKGEHRVAVSTIITGDTADNAVTWHSGMRHPAGS